MQKVSFIIVPSFSKSPWLNNKMLEVTRSFINLVNVEHADIYEVASYDEIKNYADTTEFLIIVTAGTIITDRDHLWNKIIKIDNEKISSFLIMLILKKIITGTVKKDITNKLYKYKPVMFKICRTSFAQTVL